MEIKKYLEENIELMKADLKELVAFNSVNCDDELPFGSNNRKVLDKALEILGNNGLRTKNLDYYCGYGEVGQGDKTIGILAHLDIVPAGDGWNSDPFTMVEKDGYLYGRGVSDDKGAAIAALYAIKYLLAEKYEFKKKVRLILGCNEETGSACIRHYVEKEGHIDMGFTPDGGFPGIYAEKGMIGGDIVAHNSKIIDIKGGSVRNIVCKEVNAKLPLDSINEAKLDAYFKENNIAYKLEKNEVIDLTVFGKAAHAATPDLGVNAINYLLEGLFAADFNDSFTDWFHQHFGLDLHGEKMNFDSIKDEATNTSINLGVAFKEGDDIHVTLDMRFAIKAKVEQAQALLDATKTKDNEIITGRGVNPLYFDINSPMIQALYQAYVTVTGDHEKQMEAIGGGTYAKAINNCIAFGCEFPGSENHIHDANESMAIADFTRQVAIYIQAIKNLNEI